VPQLVLSLSSYTAKAGFRLMAVGTSLLPNPPQARKPSLPSFAVSLAPVPRLRHAAHLFTIRVCRNTAARCCSVPPAV
jgi:hypothetical protein